MAADPNADYWTVADVAAYWGVSPQTIRTYRSRGRGEIPKEDLARVIVEARAPVVVETPGGAAEQRADIEWVRALF